MRQVLSACAIGIAMATSVPSLAQSRGFDWFFSNVHPSGACGIGEAEIAVSYYNKTGRPTANGEPFPTKEYTAASRTLRMGSVVHIRYPDQPQKAGQRVRKQRHGAGHSISVRINDRGPFGCGSISCANRARMGMATLSLDLSPSAAAAVGGGMTTKWVCARGH